MEAALATMRQKWQDVLDLVERARAAGRKAKVTIYPRATEADVRGAEQTLGLDFPPLLRAYFLVHDGAHVDDVAGQDLMSLVDVLELHEDMMQEHPHLVPFAREADGTLTCVNAQPGAGCIAGSLVRARPGLIWLAQATTTA